MPRLARCSHRRQQSFHSQDVAAVAMQQHARSRPTVKIDAARSGVNMPTASVLSIIARDTLLPVTSRSKKGVATVRTDALALVEACFVGREKHIRWYNVGHLAQAALGD